MESLQNDNAAIQKQVQECVVTTNIIHICSELPVSTECDVERGSHNKVLTSGREGDRFEIQRSQKRKTRRKHREEAKRKESVLQAGADGSNDMTNTNNTSHRSPVKESLQEQTKQASQTCEQGLRPANSGSRPESQRGGSDPGPRTLQAAAGAAEVASSSVATNTGQTVDIFLSGASTDTPVSNVNDV